MLISLSLWTVAQTIAIVAVAGLVLLFLFAVFGLVIAAYIDGIRQEASLAPEDWSARPRLLIWVSLASGLTALAAHHMGSNAIALSFLTLAVAAAAPRLINLAAIALRMWQALRARLRKEVLNPLLCEYVRLAGARAPDASIELKRAGEQARERYSWAVATPDALAVVARHGPIIEIGAGTGYWAWLLWQMGVDIVAYDAFPGLTLLNHFHELKLSFFPVRRGDAARVAGKYSNRTLLLCWPSDNSMASRALAAYKGDRVIYVGFNSDRDWVFTGDEAFHRLLARGWTVIEELTLPTWWPCQDKLRVYKRKPAECSPDQ